MILKITRDSIYNDIIWIRNKNRTILIKGKLTDKWDAMFKLEVPKTELYFKGKLNDDRTLNINGRPLNYNPGW